MKIYVNELHQIKAVHENTTGMELTEIETEDELLSQFCDEVICGYCYEILEDGTVTVYPYKSFSMLECIQQMHDTNVKEFENLQLQNNELILTLADTIGGK